MHELGGVLTGWSAAPVVGICGDLGLSAGFGPAWCVGRAGEDGVAAGRGCGATGVAAEANGLVSMVKAFHRRGMAALTWRWCDAAAVQAGIPDDREELPGWTRSLLPAHRRGPVRVITGRHVLPCPADAAANDGEMAGGRGGSGASAYPVSPAARTEHPAAYVLVRQSLSVIVVLQCAQKIRLNRDGNC
jgi:hypothetical protein